MKKLKPKSTICVHKKSDGYLTVKIDESGYKSEKVIGLNQSGMCLVNHEGVDYFDDNTLARLLYENHNENQGISNVESSKLQDILRNVEFVECVD